MTFMFLFSVLVQLSSHQQMVEQLTRECKSYKLTMSTSAKACQVSTLLIIIIIIKSIWCTQSTVQWDFLVQCRATPPHCNILLHVLCIVAFRWVTKPWRRPGVRRIKLKHSSSASRKNARCSTGICLGWRRVLQRKSHSVRSYKLRLIESELWDFSFDRAVLVSVGFSFQTSKSQRADDDLKRVVKVLPFQGRLLLDHRAFH